MGYIIMDSDTSIVVGIYHNISEDNIKKYEKENPEHTIITDKENKLIDYDSFAEDELILD